MRNLHCMKVFLFKYSVSLVYILSASVFVLMVAAFLLYNDRSKVQSHNHTLILQNDSIIAEHINLKNELLKHQLRNPGKKVSLSSIKTSE